MSEGAPSKRLPRHLDPRKCAHLGAVYDGIIEADKLPRLASATHSNGNLTAKLVFSVDEENRKILRGEYAIEVQVICQRCLEPMTLSLSSDFMVGIVWDESEAKGLPKELDPWVVTGSDADLISAIEEEVLLELPVVAVHDYQCIDAEMMTAGEIEASEQETGENPFQVLAQLKKKPKDV